MPFQIAGETVQPKILVIDDQKLHCFYLQKILEQEGYQNVKTISDPMKAAKTVYDYAPDLAILDLDMPQLDGFQILNQLADYRKNIYLPILALSENKGSDVRIAALQSGATDFVLQPYENLEILFRIQHLIETRYLHLAVENQNRILEARVLDRTKELRESQLDIIQRLARAAEFRDSDTGLHIFCIGRYSAALGEAWGLTASECDLLLSASPLHDVGKIGIPDKILLKPGRLTVEEFEIMKTHTTIGAQLLSGSQSPIMKMAQQIALTHHERIDGKGYPRQLRGDDIPLVGQICAVCDVFDALTSNRPYKKAWPIDQAVEEIQNEKGTHFDDKLVECFMKIIPKIVAIKNETFSL